MDYNLNIYGIGIRYALCVITGVVGGLLYGTSPITGTILLILSVVFFLEGILAFDPILKILGKDTSKDAVDDFQ